MNYLVKTTFIATIFNEESTIEKFLDSLFLQSKLPNEIIIVDGGSRDLTVEKIEKRRSRYKNYKGKFLLLIKEGNRSVGRNEAIKHATENIILCSDAGNLLDKKWIENIIKPFKDNKTDVVAGYYKAKEKNVFQKCLTPYALVMPDQVKPDDFLPATRSMAFKKSIWKKVGGFNESYSHNEDYVFAHALKRIGANIVFAKDAIVYWRPRDTYKQAFVMFFRFALGDAESFLWRTNVLVLFTRYFLGIYFLFLSLLYKTYLPILILFVSLLLYVTWAIKKNYKYVNDRKAFIILPLLQFTADGAVIAGTTVGVLKNLFYFNFIGYFKRNKFLFFIILIYLVSLIFTIKYGIPNIHHPYPYMMDEWHQLQAVANTYLHGTPNVFGSANGTMFHFLLTGLYLVPFTIFQYINPFELTIENLLMREKIFEVLRMNTIMWGMLSIVLLYKISEFIKAPKKLTIFLFTFTPIWFMLSGFFKYDIALVFWILLTTFSLLVYAKHSTNRNFILSAIPAALAIAVKVSAIPLLLIYIFSYIFFHKSKIKNVKYFFIAIGVFISTIILFGMPDTLFGRGNIILYVFENVIQGPPATANFQLGMNTYWFLFVHHYPVIFGHGVVFLFVLSLVFWLFQAYKMGLRKTITQNKFEIFLLVSLISFIISILPLQIYAIGNRSLVLLPFIILFLTLQIKKMMVFNTFKSLLIIIVSIVFMIQVYETFSWVYLRTVRSPQEIASEWMIKNLPKNQLIGIENIPIYQSVPDIIQKEYYFKQSNISSSYLFNYQIIDANVPKLPNVVILTAEEINNKLFKQLSQKDLLKRLEREGYNKKISFRAELNHTKIFLSDVDYYFSSIGAAPLTVTVFEK